MRKTSQKQGSSSSRRHLSVAPCSQREDHDRDQVSDVPLLPGQQEILAIMPLLKMHTLADF